MHAVNQDMPNGPGLFAVTRTDAHGIADPFITNVRKLAGKDRPPGSVVIAAATWLLVLLDAGLFYVSFDAQYQAIFAVKNASVPSMIEAAMLDAGMVILSALGIGLAMRGKASRTERTLIVLCALASAGMNYAAADPASWRSVTAYVAAPVFLAVITDRVISVIRRHVLPDDTESTWKWLGRAMLAALRLAGVITLYALRAALAPAQTLKGLRQMVLDAAPVPGVIEVAAVPELAAGGHQESPPGQDQGRDGPDLTFKTKKERFLYEYRQHPQHGVRSAASRVAGLIAPMCDLKPGTGRTYAYEECDRLEATSARIAGGVP
jgi:hypothetical protein